MSAPDFSIGAQRWPGLAKLAEECGELTQVIGKIVAYPDGPHPDGTDLVERLRKEMGDVTAALGYVEDANVLDKDKAITDRVRAKLARFWRWHERERAAS